MKNWTIGKIDKDGKVWIYNESGRAFMKLKLNNAMHVVGTYNHKNAN